MRKKGAMLVVFAFIALASMLLAAGTRLVVELDNSLGALFSASKSPHFVQMHAGYIDRDELEAWAEEKGLAGGLQIVEMITLDSSSLFLEETGESEHGSIMDLSLVKQNGGFGYTVQVSMGNSQ